MNTEDVFLEKIQTQSLIRHRKLIPNNMKYKELSKESVSETLKERLGEKPNFKQLEIDTKVGRHIIKAMYHAEERDYKVSNLFKFCAVMKIDLLK